MQPGRGAGWERKVNGSVGHDKLWGICESQMEAFGEDWIQGSGGTQEETGLVTGIWGTSIY